MAYRPKPITWEATEAGCHLCTSHHAADCRGVVRVWTEIDGERALRPVYQILWEREHGRRPAGKIMARLCGNRACINPAHYTLVNDAKEVAAAQGKTKMRDRIAAIRENGPVANRRRNLHPLPLPEFRKRRTRAGITIGRMAAHLGMNVSQLSRMERGINSMGFQQERGDRYLAACDNPASADIPAPKRNPCNVARDQPITEMITVYLRVQPVASASEIITHVQAISPETSAVVVYQRLSIDARAKRLKRVDRGVYALP